MLATPATVAKRVKDFITDGPLGRPTAQRPPVALDRVDVPSSFGKRSTH
jgi:hypothetical protein